MKDKTADQQMLPPR